MANRFLLHRGLPEHKAALLPALRSEILRVMQQETTPPSPRPFRVCQECGGLTPTQQPQCANCGAASVSAMIEEDERRAERNFAQAYFSRSTPVTYAILVFNVLIFLLMTRLGGSQDTQVLLAFGAQANNLLPQDEWFRLVTSSFIHIGFMHLFLNSYGLWAIGKQVEKLYGSSRFLLLYLLTGIGGSLAFYVWQSMMHRPAVGAGASASLFGLLGVLAVFGWRHRAELPGAFKSAFGRSVLPVIAINLMLGFTIPGVGNDAHIGGLITGALLALFVPYLAPGKERRTLLGAMTLLACIGLVGVCFAQAYRTSGSHLAQRSKSRQVVMDYLDGINAASRASNRAFVALSSNGNKQATATALDEAQAALEKAQGVDDESEAIRLALLRSLNEQRTLLATARPDLDKVEAVATASRTIQQRLERWARSEGGKYGLRVDEEKKEKP